MTRRRRLVRGVAAGAAAVGLGGAMFLGASVLAPEPARVPVEVGGAAQAADRGGPSSEISAMQDRLRDVPGDWTAWTALGSAYLAQAQRSADVAYYALAEEAYARSLEVRPEDNADALIGQSSLAASRHDFTAALELAQRAQAINPYSATAQGAMVDALVELGRYDDAARELQRMVDLKPDVASFTRVSYYRELTGDLDGARVALEQAGRFAFSPDDSAFVEQYLGELAFSQGDLDRARTHYEAGLRHVPGSPRLLAGRAKVAAASGDTEAALADYRTVVERLPEPGYLIAYGEQLQALGRHDEAQEQYALVEAVEALFRSQGADPDLELALFAADHGRPAAALETAEQEWSVRRSVHTQDAYAWALHVNGRHQEALEHARAAASLGGASASFAYHRGMIERALGMTAEAEASLARALELNPHFSPLQAPVARRALAELRAQS